MYKGVVGMWRTVVTVRGGTLILDNGDYLKISNQLAEEIRYKLNFRGFHEVLLNEEQIKRLKNLKSK